MLNITRDTPETSLFSAMACFSPSVSGSIRKTWVANGGTLTHTDKDFWEAKYFFCNGLDDPWLNKLLARSLIVRHANWVLKSATERFPMPIAPYTLDNDFNPSVVQSPKPLEPETTSANSSKAIETDDSTLVDGTPALLELEQNKTPEKRRLTLVTEEVTQSEGFSFKRTRISRSSTKHVSIRLQKTELRIAPSTDVIKYSPQGSKPFPKPSGPITRRVHSKLGVTEEQKRKPRSHHSSRLRIFPEASSKSVLEREADTRNWAKSQREQTNPDETFWRPLMEAYSKLDGPSGPVKFLVKDLLPAPASGAALFTVGRSYEGKNFTCHFKKRSGTVQPVTRARH